LLALRAGTQTGWAWIQVPGFSESFFSIRGQDETDLKIKIRKLLAAGARYVWVVRLIGPHRVEVYAKDEPMRLFSIGDTLEAPGILRNPVPVRALFDDKEADRIVIVQTPIPSSHHPGIHGVGYRPWPWIPASMPG